MARARLSLVNTEYCVQGWPNPALSWARDGGGGGVLGRGLSLELAVERGGGVAR